MSNLISGKEALIALANGEDVQARHTQTGMGWNNAKTLNLFSFESSIFEFRLKPKTIMLNGIEIPAPFEPKDGDIYYFLYPNNPNGYGRNRFDYPKLDSDCMQFGAWRTGDEIKQVVEALRSIFKGVK